MVSHWGHRRKGFRSNERYKLLLASLGFRFYCHLAGEKGKVALSHFTHGVCIANNTYANHTFSVAISSTGFLLQSTVSFLFPSVWASSASNVNFKWTMIHIPDGWTSKSIWWIFWWRVIYNFCLRSMVKLPWLDRINPLCLIHRSSLPEDIAFDAKDSLPRLQSLHRCTLAALTDTSTDTFCLSLFKCGIRGFDFWYL